MVAVVYILGRTSIFFSWMVPIMIWNKQMILFGLGYLVLKVKRFSAHQMKSGLFADSFCPIYMRCRYIHS